MGQGKSIRLDRFLAEMKQGTRSQVKEMIRKGRVLVDGTVCRESDRKIFPDETRVTLDGQPVGWADTEYYMLNKPQGVVSATEDGRYQTVIDLIDEAKRKDLFPVGRLDIDTEGLLLITNDGALAHELLAPKKHVDKVYFARVKGTLKEGIEARFQAGLTLTEIAPRVDRIYAVTTEDQISALSQAVSAASAETEFVPELSIPEPTLA